jgi:hypothetical protein
VAVAHAFCMMLMQASAAAGNIMGTTTASVVVVHRLGGSCKFALATLPQTVVPSQLQPGACPPCLLRSGLQMG